MQATLTLPGAEPIVLNLSDAVTRAALALPTWERSRTAAVALSAAFAVTDDDEEVYYPDTDPTEEDLIAIGEGIAAMEAGDTIAGDVFFARIREENGWTK